MPNVNPPPQPPTPGPAPGTSGPSGNPINQYGGVSGTYGPPAAGDPFGGQTRNQWARIVLSLILVNQTYWSDYSREQQQALADFLGVSPDSDEREVRAAISNLYASDQRFQHDLQTTVQLQLQRGGMTQEQAAGLVQEIGGQPGDFGVDIPDFRDPNRAANRAARQNAQSSFENTLLEWGIPLTGDMQTFVDQAVKKKWSPATFLNNLRETQAYEDAFPGIFNSDGTLRMSEDQYRAQEHQYTAIASHYGINLPQGRTAFLFENEVDPAEFQDRAQAFQMLRDNADFYRQFAAGLRQKGLAAKIPDKGELFEFVLGEGNKAWYNELQLAETRYAATEAGVKLGKAAEGYLALNPTKIEKIADKGLTPEQMAAGFQAVAQNLLTTLPLSRIQKYGLTKNDILQAQFGGKKQAEVLQLMQHIQEQEQAFYQQRAGVSIYETGSGKPQVLGGAAERPGQ